MLAWLTGRSPYLWRFVVLACALLIPIPRPRGVRRNGHGPVFRAMRIGPPLIGAGPERRNAGF